MRSSLIRRTCAASLMLAAAVAPAVAAQSDTTPAQPSAARPAAAPPAGAHARLLGEKIVPRGLSFENTTVGGLSGIDRNPCTGEYVLISDDRSVQQPARFYTAAIEVDGAGVHSVDFTSTHPFLQPDGSVYPPASVNDGKAVDPEEIRVDPRTCRYWWAQEGDRPTSATAPVIQPSIQFASPRARTWVSCGCRPTT